MAGKQGYGNSLFENRVSKRVGGLLVGNIWDLKAALAAGEKDCYWLWMYNIRYYKSPYTA